MFSCLQSVQANAVCAAQASISGDPLTEGQLETISVPVSSVPAGGVSFNITGASTNSYSNSVQASRIGASLTYQATLNTAGLLGEYKVVPVINNASGQYSCDAKVEFFNVITGTEPTQPGPINCASMAGTWADAASGEPIFTWNVTDTNGRLSGTVSVNDPDCGNQVITLSKVTGAYNSSTLTYSLDATNSTTNSCGDSAYEQKLNGTIQANSCGLGSGTFSAIGGGSGSNTMAVSERVPSGENSVATGWLDQYGAVTKAQFNTTLSSNSAYNFGGRIVTETGADPSQGNDNCTYPGAPWKDKILTLAEEDSWNVQNDAQNGSYGPDLVGLSPSQIAYIQTFSPTLGSGTCTISYPQIMVINKETSSGTESYGAANSGSNTIKFSISKTSITVQRGSGTITRPFHF